MSPEKGRGRNWRAKYLTKDDFAVWKDNHFMHLVKAVAFLKGELVMVIAIVVLILAAIGGLYLR